MQSSTLISNKILMRKLHVVSKDRVASFLGRAGSHDFCEANLLLLNNCRHIVYARL